MTLAQHLARYLRAARRCNLDKLRDGRRKAIPARQKIACDRLHMAV
jgi:hypothetical protein